VRSWHLAIGLTTCCALVGGLGCGGARPQPKSPAASTAEIDARARSDRRKLADLEHELTSLKLRVAEAEADAVPRLPVEVRAPAAAPAAPTEEDMAGEEYAQVVGVDEDGVEIVYMGDAARSGSVAPRLPARNPAYAVPRSPVTTRTLGSPPTITQQMGDTRPLEDVPTDVTDRLAVTPSVGPSVDQRLQHAPTPDVAPPAVALEPPPVMLGGPAQARRSESRTRRTAPSVRHPEPLSPRADPAKVLYDQHMSKLQAGEHEAAAAGFRALVSEYPAHELADNAQYWLGESMYARKLYTDALAAFRDVVTRYPQGNKVPDALLKIGFCHLALGETAQARTALARLIEMFPKSHPAALAAERLETLGE
jgi:tol-pal system protein YbgF